MKIFSVRWLRWSMLGLVLLLGAGFAVGSLDRRASEEPKITRGGTDAVHPSADAGKLAERAIGAYGAPASDVPGSFGTGSAGAGTAQSLSGALPPLPDRIVKNGDLTIEVAEKRFEDAWSRAFRIATGFGGYVASSSRGSSPEPAARGARSEDRIRNGEITVRVPAARFEAAMEEFRKVGRVVGDQVSSQDVTQEFTDLESRLRNLRAQQAVLLRLMAAAKSVQDTLVVQERLAQVEAEIEQITGRLKVLRSLTELSTINLHLAEPGAFSIFSEPGEGPSFAKAWDTAVEGLVRIGTVVMIAGLWLAPFAALGAAAALVARRRARPAPSA